MFEIDFHSFDHNFCESLIYSNEQHYEYFNAISSLAITFIGVNGLYKPYIDFNVQILFITFIVNGITSFFYHLLNTIGWGLLDRMSMIIIALISTLNLSSITERIINRNSQSKIIMNVYYFFIISFFTVLFTITGLHIEYLFNLLFGVFLISLIININLINNYKSELKIPEPIVKFGFRGIKYIIISGIFWLSTEILCSHIWFIKYLFGHVFWHIFVSYGGYLISLVPNYLNIKDSNSFISINYDKFGLPYLSKY
jgi:hypothetical protein